MILTSPDELPYKPVRIISLVPSQTELLHYLGLEEETIAITKFCVHPESWFSGKNRIGGTKTVNIEKIRKLKPDLIIANKEENVKEQVEELAKEFPVWVSKVDNLQDAYAMINDIGRLTRTENIAARLIRNVESVFNSLSKTYSVNHKLSTAYLIWKDPYMTIGGDTFISNLLDAAGFENIFKDRERYPEITIHQLGTMNCKLVFLSSEPYPFKQKHVDELQKELPGVKIILVDGEMFSWYGSRLLLAPGYFQKLGLLIANWKI